MKMHPMMAAVLVIAGALLAVGFVGQSRVADAQQGVTKTLALEGLATAFSELAEIGK